MPTALPARAPAKRRQRPIVGLCRIAVMLCLFMVGRWLFVAAMWCADVATGLDRKP